MARSIKITRLLLVGAAAVFLVIQFRMFASQTGCVDKIEKERSKQVESETQWASLARQLRHNVTILQEERKKLAEQVEELQLQVGGLHQAGNSTNVPASVVKNPTLEAAAGSEQLGGSDGDAIRRGGQDSKVEEAQRAVLLQAGQVSHAEEVHGKEEDLEDTKVVQEKQVPIDDLNPDHPDRQLPADQQLGKREEPLPVGLRKLPPRLRKHLDPASQALAEQSGKSEGKEEERVPGVRDVPPRLKKHLDPDSAGGAAGAQTVTPDGPPWIEEGAPPVVAAVVVLTCNRPEYLQRTLNSIAKYHAPVASKFPLFISQDGTHGGVRDVAAAFPGFLYMQHIEEKPPVMQRSNEMIAYYRIADDMDIAPDFFSYFEATADLLDTDHSLLAISSWNDNGQTQFVHDPELLYRSDFFPGLGWMLRKQLWAELKPKWPVAYWDDWLRLEVQRRGRHTIRPEMCRTFNFGKQGSSHGQYFDTFLAAIRVNDKEVSYPEFFLEGLKAASLQHSVDNVVAMASLPSDMAIEYDGEADFRGVAGRFGVFQDWKDSVPRTGYRGVVVFRYRGERRVYLVPRTFWSKSWVSRPT